MLLSLSHPDHSAGDQRLKNYCQTTANDKKRVAQPSVNESHPIPGEPEPKDLMEPRNRIRESPSHTIGDSFDLGGRNPFAGFLELVACGSLLTSVPGTGCGCGHVRGPQISRQISTSPDLTRPPQVHSLEFSGCSVVLREKIYHPFFFLCHFLNLVFFWFFFFGFFLPVPVVCVFLF